MSYRPCRNVDGHQHPPASSDRPARNASMCSRSLPSYDLRQWQAKSCGALSAAMATAGTSVTVSGFIQTPFGIGPKMRGGLFSLPSAFRHRRFPPFPPPRYGGCQRVRLPIGRRNFGLNGWNRACALLATPTCYLVGVATAYLFVGGWSGSWRQIRRQLEATGDDPKKKCPAWIGQRLQHCRAEGPAVVYTTER